MLRINLKSKLGVCIALNTNEMLLTNKVTAKCGFSTGRLAAKNQELIG